MTAKELADLVYRIYYSGNPTNQGGFELKDFELAVKDARAFKIQKDFWDSSAIENERVINSAWIKTYKNQLVEYDESIDSFITKLPSEPINIPPIGGVYLVSPMQNQGAPFHKITAGQIFIFSDMPKTFCTYYYDQEKIYYQNISPNFANKGVMIMMIPSIDDHIPDSMSFAIRDLVLAQFEKNKGLNDKTTNQNPNPDMK